MTPPWDRKTMLGAIKEYTGVDFTDKITREEAVAGDEEKKRVVDYLKTNFIDQNKLGISTGEGFYKYPNPAFKDEDFLS